MARKLRPMSPSGEPLRPQPLKPGGSPRRFAPRDPRPHAAARGYGTRWQRYRAGYLSSHPLCRECEQTGRLVPAEHVDHIVPAKPGTPGFWDRDNHQPLCHSCHSRKTVKEDGGFGRRKVSRYGPPRTPPQKPQGA